MHEETRRSLAELIQEKVALIEEPVVPDSVVDILATVGAGYLATPSAPLPIYGEPELTPTTHDELAGELVRRFHDGLHPVPPEPTGHEIDFRTGVDMQMDRHPDIPQDTLLREALATLATAFWDENDPDQTRTDCGAYIARYYLDGLG